MSPPTNKTLNLVESLDLRAAHPLLSTLLAERGEPLLVNAAHVAKVGAQCLQILVSAQMTWERDGVAFVLTNPSQAFLDAQHLAGVSLDRFSEPELMK